MGNAFRTDPNRLVWPWDWTGDIRELRFIEANVMDNGFDPSFYHAVKKGSKEHKAALHISKNLMCSPDKTWAMLGSQDYDVLFKYAQIITCLFAYSTAGAVCFFNPHTNSQWLDVDPSDPEVVNLWKAPLLIVEGAATPPTRKYHQTMLYVLLKEKMKKQRKVLWLETHNPVKGDTSETIFQKKLKEIEEHMPLVAPHFYKQGSFSWLKTSLPKEVTYTELEG